MLDTKASFQLWCLPVLYLFLAFAFNGKASDAAHDGFKAPIWSKEGMKTMVFPGACGLPSPEKPEVDQSEKHEDPNSNIKTMNDVSSLRKFIEDYKHNTDSKETFESFYKKYVPPFQKEENCGDPACRLIYSFNELKKAGLPRGYIVSAYVDPIIKLNDKTYVNISDAIHYQPSEDIASVLQRKYVQDHLAGIVKVFEPVSKRTGYILMDPGYNNGEKMTHPFVVVLMEDGGSPPPEFSAGEIGYYPDMEFSMGKDTKKPFILAKYKNTTTVEHVLYYIDKPYWSYMENTIKPYLLRPNHGVYKRDGHGGVYGSLTFQYYRTNQTNKGDIIGIQLQVRQGDLKPATHVYLPFKESTTLTYEEIKKHVEEAFGSSNVDELYHDLIEDLKFLFRELGDEHFRKDFISLQEKFY